MKSKTISGLAMILLMLLTTGYGARQTRDSKKKPGAQAVSEDKGTSWTIKTSDSVKPELRKLLEGKRVREGVNTILETPKGSKVSIRVHNGEISEMILTDRKGGRQTHPIARMATGSELGHTSADCIRTYDQCLDGCRAAGGVEEYLCNIGCAWDLYICLDTVGRRGGRRSVFLQK